MSSRVTTRSQIQFRIFFGADKGGIRLWSLLASDSLLRRRDGHHSMKKEGQLLLLGLLLLQDFSGVLEAGQSFTRGSGWAGQDWLILRQKKIPRKNSRNRYFNKSYSSHYQFTIYWGGCERESGQTFSWKLWAEYFSMIYVNRVLNTTGESPVTWETP